MNSFPEILVESFRSVLHYEFISWNFGGAFSEECSTKKLLS